MLITVLLMSFIYTLCSGQCYNSVPGGICNALGKIRKLSYLPSHNPPATSPLECFQICEQNYDFFGTGTTCQSISYDADTQHCLMYGENITTSNFEPDTSSSVRFWNVDCFSCLGCSQPIGTNILGNPGFDQWKDYILPWANDYNQKSHPPQIVSPGYRSSQAYEPSNADDEVYQNFRVCPSSTYLATFYHQSYIVPAGSPHATLQISVADVFAVLDPLRNATWTALKFLFHTSSETVDSLSLFSNLFQVDNSSYLQLDQASVERVELQASSSPSIVSNGGFENGLSSWDLKIGNPAAEACNTSSPGFQSTRSFQCYSRGYVSALKQPVLTQQMMTSEDTAYILSFDYKIKKDGIGFCTMNYYWGIFQHLLPSSNDSQTWHHFESSVYANNPVTNLSFHMDIEQHHKPCLWNLDNISLVKVM